MWQLIWPAAPLSAKKVPSAPPLRKMYLPKLNKHKYVAFFNTLRIYVLPSSHIVVMQEVGN